jgi:hypothetical protein
MPRPRWTTRRFMAAVGVLAALLGLGIPADLAAREAAVHRHVWYEWSDGTPATYTGIGECGMMSRSRSEGRRPFWGRYWGRLRGMPPPPCGEARPHPGETCSLDPSP